MKSQKCTKTAKLPKSSTETGESDETAASQKSKEKFRPAFLEAAERRHFLHEMVKSFPQSIQNRITVLKNVQIDHIAKDSEFYKEINKLEVKYALKCQDFYDKRFKIVSGKFDPPKQETNWKEVVIDEKARGDYDFNAALREVRQIRNDAVGIPNFWFTVFRNVDVIAHLIQEHDKPVLKKLIDLREFYDEQNSFTLEFHFDENDYFTDKVLKKKYTFNFVPNKQMPFNYEGPVVCKSEGCRINWKKNRNLTMRTVKRKARGNKLMFRNIPRNSFFNFFNPPIVANLDNVDDDVKETLTADYDIGLFMRSRIIPKAVLYYTGDLAEFDPTSSDEEETETESSDESDEEGAAGGNVSGKLDIGKECKNQ